MPVNSVQKFEVLKVIIMTTAVFGNVISCSLVQQTNASEEYVVSFFRIEDSLLVVCSLFNDAGSNSGYLSSNATIIVNNKGERLCKEVFVAWCTASSPPNLRTRHHLDVFTLCTLCKELQVIDHFTMSWPYEQPCWVNWFFFYFGATAPQWARASSFTRFLDHTQRCTTVGRTPLDEWSARRRDL